MSKLKNGQNWKFLQVGTKNLYTPNFWKAKPEQPRLCNTVRVTSKLPMDPTNVIASDLQVWLLALIWCKIGFFWIFCHLLLSFLGFLCHDTQVTIRGQIPYIRGIHSHVKTIRSYVNKGKYCSNLAFTM